MGGGEPVGFADIQSLNSPDRPASAFSARATGSSWSASATRRSTLRSGLGWVITWWSTKLSIWSAFCPWP